MVLMQGFLTAFGKIGRTGPRGLWFYFASCLLLFHVLSDWMLYRRPPSVPQVGAQVLRVIAMMGFGLGWAALRRCRNPEARNKPDGPRHG